MSKHRVRADEAVTLAVGVPEGQRELHTSRILRVLDQTGYSATEVEPDMILAQAAHILKVRAQSSRLTEGGDGS